MNGVGEIAIIHNIDKLDFAMNSWWEMGQGFIIQQSHHCSHIRTHIYVGSSKTDEWPQARVKSSKIREHS